MARLKIFLFFLSFPLPNSQVPGFCNIRLCSSISPGEEKEERRTPHPDHESKESKDRYHQRSQCLPHEAASNSRYVTARFASLHRPRYRFSPHTPRFNPMMQHAHTNKQHQQYVAFQSPLPSTPSWPTLLSWSRIWVLMKKMLHSTRACSSRRTLSPRP